MTADDRSVAPGEQSRPAVVRVVIVDDQPLVRAGLAMLLGAAPGVEVVGEAADGREAVAVVGRRHPDVVLMDLRMPVQDGVSATAQLTGGATDAGPKILALTTFADESLMYDALRAGASGYLLKHAAPAEIVEAVRRVHAGEAWIDPAMAGAVIDVLRHRVLDDGGDVHAVTAVLTPREQEVLRLVAHGLSNQEIRDELVVAEATVKTHVARILMKTGSRDRAAAVALAWQSGFVRQGDPRGVRPTPDGLLR